MQLNVLNAGAANGLVNQMSTAVSSDDALIILLKFGVMVVMAALLWFVLNGITSYNDHQEMVVERNRAYTLLRYGYLVAHLTSMLTSLDYQPTLACDETGLCTVAGQQLAGTLNIVYAGLTGAVVLILMDLVVNKAISHGHRKVGIQNAINPAMSFNTAIVRVAFLLTGGLIVGGVFDGSAPDAVTSVLSVVGFGVTCFVLVVAWYFANDWISAKFFHYRLRAGVHQAVDTYCYEAAGIVLALGIALHFAVAGDYNGLGPALGGFGIALVLQVALTYLVRWLFDTVFVRHTSLRQLHESGDSSTVAFVSALLPVAAFLATFPVGALTSLVF